MSTDNNQMEIVMEDVLADLEGEDSAEFSSGGMQPGVYDARITGLSFTQKELVATKGEHEGETFVIKEAVFELELIGGKVDGWTRTHRIQVGKVGDQLRDGTFQASVRRVVGEEVYQEQIRTLPSLNAQYRKSFELLLGKECRVNFSRAKGQEDDPTVSAWPRGGLLAPSAKDDSSSSNLI